jgi:hypothetical protein
MINPMNYRRQRRDHFRQWECCPRFIQGGITNFSRNEVSLWILLKSYKSDRFSCPYQVVQHANLTVRLSLKTRRDLCVPRQQMEREERDWSHRKLDHRHSRHRRRTHRRISWSQEHFLDPEWSANLCIQLKEKQTYVNAGEKSISWLPNSINTFSCSLTLIKDGIKYNLNARHSELTAEFQTPPKILRKASSRNEVTEICDLLYWLKRRTKNAQKTLTTFLSR